MAIIIRLDRVMADRKISLGQLANRVGISNVNLSRIKTGRAAAVRFSTLEAICRELDCQPGDILEYSADKPGTHQKAAGTDKPAKTAQKSGDDLAFLDYKDD